MSQERHLVHLLPSNRWGGVEKYAFDICRHFKEAGWKVTAVTRDAKAVDNHFKKEGISLRHAPFGGMFDFQLFKLIRRIIKETGDADLIFHAHGFGKALSAVIAKKLSGKNNIRIIITRHKVRKGIDSKIFKLIYRNIDAVIFVSELARKRFLSTWKGAASPFPETNLFILHNSLNIKDLPEPSHETRTGPVTAMFHGLLKPGKGIETIIDALALIKELKLRIRIVGSGRPDYVDKLRRRAIRKGVMDQIDWYKHVEDPIPLIEDCDFGVLPSDAEEAFGLTNIEYMACGKPQVTTTNGAQTEYLTDGIEAVAVPPEDPVALSKAIVKLASSPELRMKMGTEALNSFKKNLSWNKFIKKLEPIYSGDSMGV